jgi:hypothetical protein
MINSFKIGEIANNNNLNTDFKLTSTFADSTQDDINKIFGNDKND